MAPPVSIEIALDPWAAAIPYKNNTTSEPSRRTADADDNGEDVDRAFGRLHRGAHGAHFGSHFAAVLAHPDVVPAEHDDGGEKDAGVEEFLAHSGRGERDLLRKERDQDRRQDAAADAGCDPAQASGNAACRRENDPDDKGGLEDFAKDDESCRQHETPALTSRSAFPARCPDGSRRRRDRSSLRSAVR